MERKITISIDNLLEFFQKLDILIYKFGEKVL